MSIFQDSRDFSDPLKKYLADDRYSGKIDLDYLVWVASDKLRSKLFKTDKKEPKQTRFDPPFDADTRSARPALSGPYHIGFEASDRLWLAKEPQSVPAHDRYADTKDYQKRHYVVVGLLLFVLTVTLGFRFLNRQPVPEPMAVIVDHSLPVDPLVALIEQAPEVPAVDVAPPKAERPVETLDPMIAIARSPALKPAINSKRPVPLPPIAFVIKPKPIKAESRRSKNYGIPLLTVTPFLLANLLTLPKPGLPNLSSKTPSTPLQPIKPVTPPSVTPPTRPPVDIVVPKTITTPTSPSSPVVQPASAASSDTQNSALSAMVPAAAVATVAATQLVPQDSPPQIRVRTPTLIGNWFATRAAITSLTTPSDSKMLVKSN